MGHSKSVDGSKIEGRKGTEPARRGRLLIVGAAAAALVLMLVSAGRTPTAALPRTVSPGVRAESPAAERGGNAGKPGARDETRNENAGLKPSATRVVAYQIEARLDPAKKTVDATETLTYHNLTGRPLDTFPFHLYLNAFQPTSTFMREVRLNGTRGTGPESGWDAKHYGAIEVKSLEVEGQGDLTKQIAVHPAGRRQLRRPHGFPGEAAEAGRARRGRGLQNRLSRPASRSGGAHRLQAQFLHGGAVVPQGGRVVARRLELPSVSCHSGVLCRLRHLRRESHSAGRTTSWVPPETWFRCFQSRSNQDGHLARRGYPRLRLDGLARLQAD